MKEKKVKRFLVIVTLVLMGALCFNGSFIANSAIATKSVELEQYTFMTCAFNDTNTEASDSVLIDVNFKRDSLRLKLINDVDRHIRKNFKIHDSNLPMYLVDNSIKYNIDLCFMMAQTTIETGFGTAGAGRPTTRHSLFGVCKRYSNYETAVEDYCVLLKKSYMGDKKTEYDLMKRYVTLEGARYAGSRSYERHLTAEYNRIKSKTDLYETWNELRNS